MKRPLRSLAQEEHGALQEYARRHGAYWKDALRAAWIQASEPGILQALRNDRGFGPAGLIAYRIPGPLAGVTLSPPLSMEEYQARRKPGDNWTGD